MKLRGHQEETHGQSRIQTAIVMVACLATMFAVSGCSLTTRADAGDGDEAEALYPKKQLCRIGKSRSSGRYIALITPNCAADSTQVGLKSSYSRANLESLGAN